jgi:hypothetical protein
MNWATVQLFFRIQFIIFLSIIFYSEGINFAFSISSQSASLFVSHRWINWDKDVQNILCWHIIWIVSRRFMCIFVKQICLSRETYHEAYSNRHCQIWHKDVEPLRYVSFHDTWAQPSSYRSEDAWTGWSQRKTDPNMSTEKFITIRK